MADKIAAQKERTQEKNEKRISLEQLQVIDRLVDRINEADVFYAPCECALFRAQVRSILGAPSVQAAVGELKEYISSSKGSE